jgi:hypothetical protein
MKIQCSCGKKYEFEVTPEMINGPIRFVCSSCGLDASDYVTQLVHQQHGVVAAPSAPPPVPSPVARVAPMRVAPVGAVQSQSEPVCSKHGNEPAVEQCRVCGKPICIQCMELFGYVCSPLCRARASSTGIDIPVFAGQKSVREARRWKILGWSGGAVGALVILVLGTWFWYAWFGCVPRPVFSVRFPERSYSGQTSFGGKLNDQIFYLHGDTLARHEMDSGKQVWSRQLLDRKKIAADVQNELKEMAAAKIKAEDQGYTFGRMPDGDKLQKEMEKSLAAAMRLFVRGENVWVATTDKLVRFDWASGAPKTEIPIPPGAQVNPAGDELIWVDDQVAMPVMKQVNVASGEVKSTDIAAASSGAKALGNGSASGAASGLERVVNNNPRAMDPQKVAQHVESLRPEAKIALPALLAASINQQRVAAELDGLSERPRAQGPQSGRKQEVALPPMIVPTPDGYVQLTMKLLERRMVERVAMKPAPAKSALDGNVSAGRSMEIAGDMLNEMQRELGGDKVTENLSRYEVTLQSPDGKDSWTGEVTGPPELYPLNTVLVLASSKSILVLDKSLKKKWQASLSYDVTSGPGEQDELTGLGPCVERKGTLLVADQGMLSAFDLGTGKVRWRLPTVGIFSMFFDTEEMLYLNTTTATHDSLKFSKQINIMQMPGAVILKVNPANGEVLWRNDTAGMIGRLTGKYIFTMASNDPIDEEIEGTSFQTGFEKPPFIRIRRLNPKNGREVWEHFQQRAPLDVQFEDNYIRLVFRKEVQVLKFAKF